jgi:hypothetical protein
MEKARSEGMNAKQSKNKNKNKNRISSSRSGSSCHLRLLGLSRMTPAHMPCSSLDCDSSGMLLQNYACLADEGSFFSHRPALHHFIPSIPNDTNGLFDGELQDKVATANLKIIILNSHCISSL